MVHLKKVSFLFVLFLFVFLTQVNIVGAKTVCAGQPVNLNWSITNAAGCVPVPTTDNQTACFFSADSLSGSKSMILSSGSCHNTLTCNGIKAEDTLTVDPSLGTWDASKGACVQKPAVNKPPIGALDELNCSTFYGWAQDPDEPGKAIDVHFYDGPAPTKLLGGVTASQGRSDVGNHAYFMNTYPSLKDGAVHTLYAYAIDSSGGNNPVIGTKTISGCFPPPNPVTNFVTVNGSHNVTLNNNDSVTLAWGASDNATNYNASYSSSGPANDLLGNGCVNPVSSASWDWINGSNFKSGGAGPISMGDYFSGCTINVTYSVTGPGGVSSSDSFTATIRPQSLVCRTTGLFCGGSSPASTKTCGDGSVIPTTDTCPASASALPIIPVTPTTYSCNGAQIPIGQPCCAANSGAACSSEPGACGDVGRGIYTCEGTCNAQVPDCPPVSITSFSAQPNRAVSGNTYLLSWTSTGAQRCSIAGLLNGAPTESKQVGVSGNTATKELFSDLTAFATYTLNCFNVKYSDLKSLPIQVLSPHYKEE